ncbi:MAG: amino acid permease [Lachnospiraceae bacterium]
MGEEKKGRKLSLWTLILLIVVPTFGFGNITNNVVALGPASVPSWLIVAVLFFLPLSLFIPELASADEQGSAGVYTWIKAGLGEKWAFIGTWSYFVSTLFYLQMVFARIPVMVSWTIFGENRFSDSNAYLLPYMSIILAIILTFIASTGVKKFSKISNFGGKLTMALTAVFIVFAFAGLLMGTPSETKFTVESLTPTFDTSYFATFAWLLLAVAGAEVGGTYVKDVENPKKNFKKAVFIATFLIAFAYIIGSVAVLVIASPEAIQEAGVKDAAYMVYERLAENWGLNGGIAVRLYALSFTITSVAAYIVWMDSPLRALFSEVPEGTFPKVLTKQAPDGTMKNALWIQCGIVIILITVPLFGLGGIDALFNLLTDLSALSSVPAYAMLAIAFLVFRLKKKESAFTVFKNNTIAVPVAVVTIGVAVLAYIGAGLDYFIWAETKTESMILLVKTYGGPIALIILGYILRSFSLKKYHKKENKEKGN